MDYKLVQASKTDTDTLIKYKSNTIFEYAENLSMEEINKINNYIEENIPKQLSDYQLIHINDKDIGCLLVYSKDDGVLLDEIYIEKEYREQGIGTKIIKDLLLKNNIVYLWVYKLNTKAISLYKKLGFIVIEETKSRYYMKYEDK